MDNYFAILDKDRNYFITLSSYGIYTTGSINEAHRMGIIELEEWIKIIKKYRIEYKVTTLTLEYKIF